MADTRATLTIRIPAELKADLEAMAREQRRSLNNLIEVILDAAREDTPFVDEVARRRAVRA